MPQPENDYLTDAERALIAEGDDDSIDADADTDLPPEDDEDEGADPDAGENDDASPPEEANADADAELPAEENKPAASSDKDEGDKNADIEAQKALDAAVARRKEIETEIEALNEEFDQGDLTSKEFREKLGKFQEEQHVIEKTLLKQEVALEVRAEQDKKEWESAQAKFFGKEENKRFADDENLLMALNSQVIKLARGEMAAASGEEILAAARANVAKSFGLADAPKPVEKQTGKPARPARPAPTPDIGGLPAAAVERPQSGKFAHLDGLRGEALEDAVGRLSKADQDEYARAN